MKAAGGYRWPVALDRVVAGYLAVTVVAGLARPWSSVTAWLLLGLSTAAVLAAAPRLYPREDASGWYAMAVATVFFTAGYVVPLPRSGSPVRLVDVLYVPAYALTAIALRRLTRHVGASYDLWDAAVLTGGLLVLLVPLLAGLTPHTGAATLEWLYPFADLLILALSVQLARASPSPSSWLLAAAAVWLLASGFLRAWIGVPDESWLVQTLRAGFLACWGLAALWPLPLRKVAIDDLYHAPPVWLFALVVLLVPAALLIRSGIDGDTREVVFAVACAAVGLFVVARLGSAARATARDPVTGLIVLPVLLTKARAMLAAGRTPTLFLAEMRQFYMVREKVGRDGGAEVLRGIGRRLVGAAGDAVVAWGSSDRFAVLAELPAADGADGADGRLGDELLAAVTAPLTVNGRRLQITWGLGYATARTDTSVEDLLVNAETALHAARDARPGSCVAYHPALRAAELEAAELTDGLREAIDGGQLFLEYQPIVVLADGLVAGFEALVRWQHPRLGRLGPDRFIQLAESAGLIGDLGAWVLREGIAGIAALNATARRTIFVDINVSAEQFGPRLAEDLREALTAHAVDPALVVLEVTETVLIPDRQWLANEVCELKATGVRLAVDDFGTGHSSLARLKDLPIDVIKVDRMFVTALRPGAPAKLMSGILQIADALGVDVVAEGIEQASERDLLAKLGCRLGQGYLYGRSVPLPQAQALLLAGPVIRQRGVNRAAGYVPRPRRPWLRGSTRRR